MLTLQELLAGVLLVEGLVDDRTGKVVDHELEDGLDLLLGVASIVSNGGILTSWLACVFYPVMR